MSDEIRDYIDKKNADLCDRFEKSIDGYTNTIVTLISSETQSMRHSIDELTKRVDKQNGSVHSLREWQAEVKGAEAQKGKSFSKTLQVIGVVIAFGSLLVAFVVMSNKTTTEVRDMIDQYGYDITTRSADSLNIM